MKQVLAIQQLNPQADVFALLLEGGMVFLYNQTTKKEKHLVSLDKVKHGAIQMKYCPPYLCMSERFGLHSAVINLESGEVQCFSREEYHSNVASYSIGFLQREGRVLLLHQTQWNRLDLTDLATGTCLTKRDCYIRNTKPSYKDAAGKWVAGETEQKNYLGYFHSLLHISPGGTTFLSNGFYPGV